MSITDLRNYRRVFERVASSLIAVFASLALLTNAATMHAQDAIDTTRADEPADTTTYAVLPLRVSDGAIRFSGDSRVVGQFADRSGLFQEVPDDYARLEITPTLEVYDVPFSANLLLSTEQNERRQSLNSIVFGLDFRQLQANLIGRAMEKVNELRSIKAVEAVEGAAHVKDSLMGVGEEGLRDLERMKGLADYEKLRERAFSESAPLLQELGVLSATEKFFMNFPALEIGVTYPRYTPLTLTNVPVTGANIEFNPGLLYVAFAGGTSQRVRTGEELIRLRSQPALPEFVDTVIAPTYNRTLYAGRLGVGKRDASHFFLTTMWARDDETEIAVDSLVADSLGVRFAPKSNVVIGVDAVLDIVDDLLRIEGELTGSVINGDTRTMGFKNDDIPSFLVDIVEPNLSTSIDYAYSVKSTLNIADIGTKLSAMARMIGPGYQSLGAPTLRNDLLRYDIRFEQRLLQRQIAITSFYRHDRDNLVAWKPGTTAIDAYGIGLGLTFRKLPYLRLNFAPYHQTNDLTGERAVDNTTTTFSAIAGYSFRTGPLANSANITYSLQNSATNVAASDYGIGNVSLNYTAMFEFPLMLNASVGLSDLAAGSDSTASILTFDIGGSFTAFDIWESSLGINIGKQTDVDSRFGFFVGSTLALWDYGYFDVRAEKNTYDNSFFLQDTYDEFLIRATLTTRW